MQDKKRFCFVCNKNRTFKLFSKTGDKNYCYFKCNVCGVGILLPKPKSGEILKIYSNKRYFVNLSKPYTNKFLQKMFSLRLYSTSFDWVNEVVPHKGLILDVGCGSGEFIRNMINMGWKADGIDISKKATQIAQKLNRGANIYTGKFDKFKTNKKFDAVSFWHVLEHLENPNTYIKKAYKVLRKSGYVLGEVPNYDSWILKIFRKDYNWYMIPDHLIYYSGVSLEKMLKNSGFRKIKIYTPPRALTNLSQSLILKYFRNYPPKIKDIVFYISVPLSVLFVLLQSMFNCGEVIRFSAIKSK